LNNNLKTSEELIKTRVKEYEAYLEKRAHLMEFIHKFRFNAKRATVGRSLVKVVKRWIKDGFGSTCKS